MRISKRIRKFIEKTSFPKILLIAIVLRLVFLPFFFHGDLNNHAIWGIYAQEFGFRGFYDWLNFGNYAWPGYPPLTLIIIYLMRLVWQVLFNLFWFLNVSMASFPSPFIPWFKDFGYLMVLKLPAIASDLGIGLLIYLFFKSKKRITDGKTAAIIFLFNPGIIYLSSLWGQLESVICFFILLSVLKITRGHNAPSIFWYFVSLMFKATTLVAAPVIFLKAIKNRMGLKEFLAAFFAILGAVLIVSYIFIDKNYITWFVDLYTRRLLPGPDTLPFITVNAFNFWSIIFGQAWLSDSTVFLGASLRIWAYLVSSLAFLVILFKFSKDKSIFLVLMLMFLAAFMFLPRMHERYVYPAFVFFPFILFEDKRFLRIFILLSITFLLNMYHGWWVPQIKPLIYLLSIDGVVRALSLLNLLGFGYILKIYLTKWNFSKK